MINKFTFYFIKNFDNLFCIYIYVESFSSTFNLTRLSIDNMVAKKYTITVAWWNANCKISAKISMVTRDLHVHVDILWFAEY